MAILQSGYMMVYVYCMINLFNIGHIKSAVGLVGSSSLQNWPTTSFDAFLPFRPMVSKPYLWRSTGTHPVSFHVTCRRGTGLLFQRLQHLSQHFGRGVNFKMILGYGHPPSHIQALNFEDPITIFRHIIYFEKNQSSPLQHHDHVHLPWAVISRQGI